MNYDAHPCALIREMKNRHRLGERLIVAPWPTVSFLIIRSSLEMENSTVLCPRSLEALRLIIDKYLGGFRDDYIC